MSEGASRFFNSIEDSSRLSEPELIDFFVYYLTNEAEYDAANAMSIAECFKVCDLTPPTRTAPHLSEGLKSKPQKFVKVDGGYKLQRHYRETLSKRLGAERVVVQASAELRRLEGKLVESARKGFLKETIDCFEIGANRATIVMCWLLVMDHLFELVLMRHLTPFNAELAKVTDKRVKVSTIASSDDFEGIPEGKFIELLKAASIISNAFAKY